MTTIELIFIIALIATSGFLSSSEVALFSLSRFQLRALREKFRPVYKRARTLLADPSGVLLTILLINEIVNISLSTLFSAIVARDWPEYSAGTLGLVIDSIGPDLPIWAKQAFFGIVMTTPIVIFFCEITPKVIGAKASQLVTLIFSKGLFFIYQKMRLARILLKRVSSLAANIMSRGRSTDKLSDSTQTASNRPLIREEEFLSMVEEGITEGTVKPAEFELIRNVFNLDDHKTLEIITPINQVYSLAADTSIAAALTWIKGTPHYSRFPVYDGNKSRIVGVLYTKDLLLSRLNESENHRAIREIMHPPFRIAAKSKLNTLFRRLKQKKVHMAIVEDQPNHCSGIVTMQDVLDALFEDVFTFPASLPMPNLPPPMPKRESK